MDETPTWPSRLELAKTGHLVLKPASTAARGLVDRRWVATGSSRCGQPHIEAKCGKITGNKSARDEPS
jgi:hypothetical protein